MNSQFFQHLTQEHSAVGAFIELLDQEAAAMQQGRYADLPSLIECKSRLADRLAILGRQRENEQMRLGYRADRQGAETLAAAGGPSLQKVWHALCAATAQAHERNHRNGMMIRSHLHFTGQPIALPDPGGTPPDGPGGQYSSRFSGSSLVT